MNKYIYTFMGCLLLCFSQEAVAQTTTTFTLTQAPCNNDGVLTADFTGLTPPLTVTWQLMNNITVTHTNVSSLSDALINYSGEWVSVVATDAGSAIADGVFSAPPFTFQINSTPAPCPAMGSVSVTVSGGAPPYTYVWTDANANIVGTGNPLIAPTGQYDVAVTDANGCVFSTTKTWDSVVIISVAPFSFSLNTTSASCTNGTATIANIVGSGTPPYSYSWSNNANTQSINNLVTGVYTATLTDAIGCSATQSAYITQSPQITVNVTPTAATCTQNDGALIAFGAGGTSPYSYSWNNGPSTQSQTNVSPGSYSVAVTDANGCIGTGYSYIYTSTPIAVGYSVTASSCTSATGSATLAITGGQAPYAVSWSTFPAQSGTTINNMPAGNYTFAITDANGCTQSGTVAIPPANIISANLAIVNANCTQPDGMITANPTGGNIPYGYLWSNNATTASISGLPTGNYWVTITDANGCSITKNASVATASPINIGIAASPASCEFEQDGNIVATPTGGTAPYTYSWSDGQTTATATNLAAGSYYVHVSDAAGCVANAYTNLPYDPTGTACYCTITGTVYDDQNNNCIQDIGEAGIQNIQIHCSGIGYTYTDASGVYSFHAPSGSYTVSESIQTQYPLSVCQNNNISLTTVAAPGCTETVSFANAINTIHDLHINTWNNSFAVPGNVYNQTVILSNQGTVAENSVVSGYSTDGQLNTPSFVPAGIFVNGANNWYSATSGVSLAPGTSQAFSINYNVPTNIPINTALTFMDTSAYMTPLSNWLNDYTPWNNVNYIDQTVVSSYDPNFKEVIPKGEGPEGLISMYTQELDYMVHFQNLGTYFAQNIVVIDTLDANLDWTTLKPIYSSHPGKVSIDENGVLKYTFTNILLPPAMTNNLESQGMFSYSISMKAGLSEGTQIRNNAAIYFDYNEPVITNTTLNTLYSPEGIHSSTLAATSFTIYPNPARGRFYIGLDNKESGPTGLLVTDVSGKVVHSWTRYLREGKQIIPLSANELSTGIYFVTLSSKGSRGTQKLVIIK